MEKRHNYVRKVAEVATQMFISNDKVNIAGLILAGSADFKTELSQSDMFDPVSMDPRFDIMISTLISLVTSSDDKTCSLEPYCISPLVSIGKTVCILSHRDCKLKLSRWWTSLTVVRTVSTRQSSLLQKVWQMSNSFKKRN